MLGVGVTGIILSLIADGLAFLTFSYKVTVTGIIGIIGLILGLVALKEKGSPRYAGIIAVILAIISFILLGVMK